MPVLDTLVLFGVADPTDRHHERARRHLESLEEVDTYLASFALLEFDVILKSRSFSFEERMEMYAFLLRDYPALRRKVAGRSPATLYLTSRLEAEVGLEYFDAGIAAEALQFEGKIVSTDRAFDRIETLKRIW